MAYTQKDNSGTLGVNRRKEKDTHPSHSGQCVIDGTEYWISAWVKESNGSRFFSLAFKPKEERQEKQSKVTSLNDPPDFNDDIPF